MEFYVRGFGANTTATADMAVGQLWNPSGSRRICVRECAAFQNGQASPTAGYPFYITRTTARGTAGSTVTPDADNSGDGVTAPVSGALLDVSLFSVQPTFASPALKCPTLLHTGAGGGFIERFTPGVAVLPGTGLAIVQRLADTCGAWEITFVFEE
jgi:hypothetical protein